MGCISMTDVVLEIHTTQLQRQPPSFLAAIVCLLLPNVCRSAKKPLNSPYAQYASLTSPKEVIYDIV